MSSTKKVAVVQRILAHYRKPIFQLLCRQQEEIEYTLFSNPINSFDSVKGIDYEDSVLPVDSGGLRWQFLKNIWFFRYLLWQKGVISLSLSRDYDVVIFEGASRFLSTWIGVILARLTGKRVLMWSHGFLRDEKGLKGWIRKRFYRLAHGLLLYHNRAKEICIKKGFNPENLYVVYNSLDYDTQVKTRASITDDDKMACRKRLFKSPDLPILLFIGRLTPQKKLTMIIDAAKILKDSGRECNILFIGGGDDQDNLSQFSSQAGLAENVCFYGSCYEEKEIALLISVSDVCVAPGEVGLTCMHSLVYGTPVITHDDPDCQMPEYEAIKPEYNGAFFKKDSVSGLADTIEKWLKENKDRLTVAARCHEVIDRCYNPHYQFRVINEAVLSHLPSKNNSTDYDFVFVTNLPAFYKVNLYNRIAQKKKILVVFTQESSPERNEDFYGEQRHFEQICLGNYGVMKRTLKLASLIIRIKYNKLIISGWNYPDYWLPVWVSGKSRNAIVIESSVLESSTTGWRGILKRMFLSRISEAYVSGKLQQDLVLKLKFQGELKITKGVGVFNVGHQPPYTSVDKVSRFLYVGRLSPEKNLVHLVETFNHLPHLTLNIIGFGPQENQLKQLAASNIVFLGAIANIELPKYYRENDVLVLPSISEPWGLVVEEAMNNGLPVIVSDKVGCALEVVVDGQNGIVFNVKEQEGLLKAVLKITEVDRYNKLRKQISEMDFQKITEEQVSRYSSSN